MRSSNRKKQRICDIAERVLRETNNPAVMWGDSGLLDMIAERSGRWIDGEHPYKRWQRVLNALSKQPGNLLEGRSLIWMNGGDRRVRRFNLPPKIVELLIKGKD